MPNYVKNLLKMEGIAKEPLFGVAFEKKIFDFNTLIPIPREAKTLDDWYYWRLKSWGTKWNSSELKIIDDDTISFNTAWTNPEPIIRELARRYLDRVIEHWWADENVGFNTGYRRFANGEWYAQRYEDRSQEALDTFATCWFMTPEEMDDFFDGDDSLQDDT